MSAANHAPDARLDPFALDVELSLLLSSTAPPGWRSAVEEAAHLLSDRYSDDWAELHTLALLLFARTFSGARTPRDVPVEELVQALDDPSTGENRVTEEIRQALKATGQEYDTGLPDEEPPLRLIFGPVSDRYGGPAHWSDEWDPVPPGPSPLDRAAKRLVGYRARTRPATGTAPRAFPTLAKGLCTSSPTGSSWPHGTALSPRVAVEAAPPRVRDVSPLTAPWPRSTARGATRDEGGSSSIPRRCALP